MPSSLPIIVGLSTLLLVLIGWRWWHRSRDRSAPLAGSVADGTAQDDAGGVRLDTDPLRLMQQSQRGLHALALGFDPEAPPIAEPDGAQRAVMTAVIEALGRDALSPRLIPRRPQLLPQLIQSVNDEGASSRSIGAIIGQDPVLAGNLLRIANSALYHLPGRTVDSIERAVTLVGSDGVRQIITAALLQPVMSVGGHEGGRFSSVIWEFSLRAAAAAADHARGVEHDDGFAAQLMGLLQGLGAVVVMQAAREEYARHPSLPPSPLLIALLLERCTCTTAARIATHWQLAPAICRILHENDSAQAREHALGRSLQFARTAAALAMLCQEGRMEDGQALSLLQDQAPPHALDWIWRRIRQSSAGDAAASTARR